MSLQIEDLGVAANGRVERQVSDAQYVRNMASTIQDVLLVPTNAIGGCGRPAGKDREALCKQRLVLIALGWLEQKHYGKADIREHSVPAIEQFQRALGVRVDGKWAQKTNAALDRVLKEELGQRATAFASGRYLPPAEGEGVARPEKKDKPALPPPPAEEKSSFLVAGLGLLALGAVGLTLVLRKRKGEVGAVDMDCPDVQEAIGDLGNVIAVMKTVSGQYAVLVHTTSPGGHLARYSAVHDKVKDARREAKSLQKKIVNAPLVDFTK